MASDADYINQALRAGVPLESVQRFLADNPGDHERLMTAFAEDILPGADEFDRQAVRSSFGYDWGGVIATNGHERAADIIGAFVGAPLTHTDSPTNIAGEPVPATPPVSGGYVPPSQWDRNLIANVNEGSPVGWEMQPEGWRDVIGTIIGTLPIPGADFIGGIVKGPGAGGGGTFPGAQLPMPAPRPQLPAPRPSPAPRPPTTINIGGPRVISAAKWAKIAAAAAALGISVEEYIRRYGIPRKTPSMNPLNPRALRRAMTRTERFACFARGAIRMAEKYQRPKGRKTRKRKCA